MATILLSLTLSSTPSVIGAQNLPEPRREVLLNGLHILLLTQPASPTVTIALRINSGSAFDLIGKEGTMALLGDQLFPDAETRDYFRDELGGSLEVTTNYDSLTILMNGHASEFERMLEILRTALINTPISDQSVARLRDARKKEINESSAPVALIADRAIGKRLYGNYPYGRPIGGTLDSLANIDRPDLLQARERFHTPDNSTLVVIGGVQESRALRALRQLLGVWRKSDKLVPSTFRMPDAPDPRLLVVDARTANEVEIRLAVRTVSRSDNDYPAMTLLALLLRNRWRTTLSELNRHGLVVQNESYLMSGVFVMGASVPLEDTTAAFESARKTIRSIIDAPPSASEMEQIRNETVANLRRDSSNATSIAIRWLDTESYKLPVKADLIQSVNKVSAADIQRVASRLFRDASFASVAVGNAAQIKANLESTDKFEVLGESPAMQSTLPTSPTKSP